MSDFLVLLDWIAGLLFAGALAMTALTDQEIRAARSLVFIAAGVFAMRWVLWGFSTDQSLTVRLIVGAVAGSFLLGVLPPSLRWISDRSQPKSAEIETVAIQSGLYLTNTDVISKNDENVAVQFKLKNASGESMHSVFNEFYGILKYHRDTKDSEIKEGFERLIGNAKDFYSKNTVDDDLPNGEFELINSKMPNVSHSEVAKALRESGSFLVLGLARFKIGQKWYLQRFCLRAVLPLGFTHCINNNGPPYLDPNQ